MSVSNLNGFKQDSVDELLSDLAGLDIRLKACEGRLGYDAPAGRFTDELKQRVQVLRPDLLARLRLTGQAAPLSPGQERMWFLNRIECQEGDGSGRYTEHLAFSIDGPLDTCALKGAISILIARHSALRTTFRDAEGGPEQVILPVSPADLEIVDLESDPSLLEKALAAAGRRRVDLATDPHVAFKLFVAAPDHHVLSVSAHHAAWDGWSNGVFAGDLAIAYNALHANERPVLPPLGCDIATLARAQRDALGDSGFSDRLERLCRALKDFPTRLELPTDRPRPEIADGRGDELMVRIPPDVATALSVAARTEGATPYMALLAAWALLLARVSGSRKLLIGAPVAAREGSDEEAVIGYLSNTIAIPVDVGTASTFGALVGHVRERVLEAMAGRDLPFEKVVESIAPPRSRATTPLVQSIFAMQPRPVAAPALDGLTVKVLPWHNKSARYELLLNLEPAADGGLEGPLTYATALFDRSTVAHWADEFLKQVREAPRLWNQPLSTKSEAFSTATEHALAAIWGELLRTKPTSRDDDFFVLGGHSMLLMQVLHRIENSGLGRITLGEALGATRLSAMAAVIDRGTALSEEDRKAYPRDVSIAELWRTTVEQHSERIAISRRDGRSITYAELDRRAETIASCLLAAGPLGNTVALAVERGFDAVAAILGIWKAGAAYMPLDAKLPHAAVAQLSANAGASVLLADAKATTRFAGVPGLRLLRLEELREVVGTTAHAAVSPGGEDPAYVMFTSGSTGRPKGVVIPHRAIARLALNREILAVNPGDVVAQAAPLAFDASTFELWSPLLQGARLHIIDDEDLLDPAAFASAIRESGVTVLWLTSGLFNRATDHDPAQFAKLRLLITGGETVSVPHVRRVLEACPALRLCNGYGPTENCTFTTAHVIGRADLNGPIPIGRPLAGNRIYIVDEGLLSLPDGSWGELVCAGDGLALGYAGSPDQTAASFVMLPGRGGDRVYRTGDIVRRRTDGVLEFQGRRDGQVKIHGHRIETGAIEAILCGQPGVREAAVVLTGTGEDKALVACVVADRLEESAWRRALAEQLPVYMMPASFERVASIPVNANGKRDREALLRLATQPSTDYPLSTGQERLWLMQRVFADSGAYNVPLILEIKGALNPMAFNRALTALEERHHALRLRVFADTDDRLRQRLTPPGQLVASVVDLRAEPDPQEAAGLRFQNEVQRPFRLEEEPGVRALLLQLGEAQWHLVLMFHHAIIDGWSLEVIVRDLAALYSREAGVACDLLPPPECQFEDVAVWQRKMAASGEGEALLARCAARLSPLPPALELPADRRRPKVKTFHGDTSEFTFNLQRTAALDRLAHAESATPLAVTTALVQLLLYRLTGQTDLALGTLAAGRDRAETQRTAGFLVNTLVLRQSLDPSESFRTLLTKTRATCVQAVSDQNCPFEELVQALNVPRDLSRNPLFDVMVVCQTEELEPPLFAGLKTRQVPFHYPFSKFDLSFHFRRRGDRLTCQIEYSSDLFDADTVASIFAQLDTLTGSVLAEPGASACSFSILPESDAIALDRVNATEAKLDTRRTIIQPLLDCVKAAPLARAVLWGDGVALDYQGFARRAGAIARRLAAAGVRKGQTVAICARRSPDMLAAIHGVLMAGAAYAPLSPDDPATRLTGMLEDLGRPAVLASLECRGKVGAAAVVLDLETTDEAEPVDFGIPDGLAYVLFTSGSTGRPKGVEIEHHSVLNRILWMQATFPIGPGDVILQKTPITFDVSVWELFWWAWTGAAVALPPPGAERDPLALVDLIERHRVTVIHFVPSMLSAFLACIEDGRADARRLRCLRYVFSSGEALDAAQAERFDRLLHRPFGVQLHNLYGPTEATVDVTWHPCSPWNGGEVVPIGRPIANTTVHVLDREGRRTPIGVPGEIHIGGPQVACGYVNRPELTREKFIPDPFREGGRLYRTGDLGRWRRDGTVEYLGRMDGQVKIRGQRIETGEVEQALETHPSVERAAVAAVNVDGLTELHGYVLTCSDITHAALRDYLRDLLPEGMVPARFFRLASLPLTSSGKLDRKALTGTPLDRRAALPSTVISNVEAEIQAIWKSLLPDSDPGPTEGFFDAGGNSLLVVRLHERLNGRWPGVFSIADLFASATIREQARKVAPLSVPSTVQSSGKQLQDRTKADAIAVVGIAVRLPGSEDLDSFWQDVSRGADRVGHLPPGREADARSLFAALQIPAPEQFHEEAYLEDIYSFDPRRFRMSPADAALLDPEQRLFLETALRALEDAGRGGTALDHARVAVFAGGTSGMIFRDALMRTAPDRADQIFALNVPSNVATRLSFLHNWRGPAALIDTACSSTLVAVDHACRALREGRSDWAVVGGARISLLPHGTGRKLAIDSSTGRTHAFDASADGTGSGEGSIVFVLRPLTAALADGDAIHGVILGSAVNQDGASSGMAAPNPEAQAEVIAAAARDAQVPLASLSYIEAHGTGTALGDPVEIDGLTRAFSAETTETRFAAIGSGKGNYGHLDGTAGALGLARALMCLGHDSAPPQPFFTGPNPRIDFDRAPVAVSRTLAPLADRGCPRRAGVSAFGLSGINAHVIVEAAPPLELRKTQPGWVTVGLSAPDEVSLRGYAGAVVRALRTNPGMHVEDIARTLTDGRDLLPSRLAVWVKDRGDLMARLAVFAAAPDAVDGLVVTGTPVRGNDAVTAFHSNEDSAKAAAAAFVGGSRLSWPADHQAGRVHLPPVPLDRRRCAPGFPPPALPVSHRHCLLGEASATPQGNFYPIDVHAPEFWPAAEHRLDGAPTLVGMAFPSLLAESYSGKPLRIRDLRWIRLLRPAELERATVTIGIAPDGTATLTGRTPEGRWLTFARATIEELENVPQLTPIDLAAIVGRCAPPVEKEACVRNHGIVEVSDRWNALDRAALGSHECLGWLHTPAEEPSLLLHPGLLDVAASFGLPEPGLVPAGCESIVFSGSLPAFPVAYVSWRRADSGILMDVHLADRKTGVVSVVVEGLRFSQLTPEPSTPVTLATPVWHPAPVDVLDPGGEIMLIGEGPLAERVSAYLVASGRLSRHCSSEAIDVAEVAKSAAIVFAPAGGADTGHRVFTAMRTIVAGLRAPTRLLALGEGAYATESAPIDPFQAITYGVVQAAALEEPLLTARYVDTDRESDPGALVAELAVREQDRSAIAWRGGRRWARGFEPLVAAQCNTVWPSHGCCVVSGGTGGLSLLLAETLANERRVALALLSRTGVPRGDGTEAEIRRERLERLRKSGLRIEIYPCDVADRTELASVLARIRSEIGPITAVVHNAAVPGGAFLASGDHSATSFAEGLRAKVNGTCLLDELTSQDPVQAFVMGGSLTSLTGHAGYAAYTGANAFLDAFAAARSRRGKPALTIDWCEIGGIGMAARARRSSGIGSSGITDVGPLLMRALASGAPQVAVLVPEIEQVLKSPLGRVSEPQATTADPITSEPQPGRALETAIAAVWASVLGYDSVAPGTDFYELGGDSLAGARIVRQIVDDLGHPMTLTDLFEAGTVAALVERLRGRVAERSPVTRRIAPAPARDRYPVAWEQLAVLRAEQAAEVGTAYNLPSGLELPADVDVDRLRSAATSLIARHEILRTRFIRSAAAGDEPEMEVLPPRAAVFEEVELPDDMPLREALQPSVRPFDLWSGVAVRFILARVRQRPRALLIDVHHALADAFSMELLVSELVALYRGAAIPAPALQLKDYAWWSRCGAGRAASDEARSYWLERFAGSLPALDLPADRSRPAHHTWQAETLEFPLAPGTLARLRAFAAERRTTPFTAVTASWALLLARYARTEDLVIASPVDSRDSTGISGMAGMLVTLVPLRMQIHAQDTVTTLLERAHSVSAEAQRYRAYGLGRLLEDLAPPAAPDRVLLADVNLSYMNFAGGDGLSGDASGFTPFSLTRRDGKSDLAIYIRDLPDCMTVSLEYYSAIFDRNRMERMGRHWRILLDALLAADPELQISRLPLLDEDEARWLAVHGLGAQPALALDRGLCGAFLDRAQSTPGALALVGPDLQLSYGELVARSSGIAKRLRDAGITSGDRVGLHVERDASAIVLVLGIVAAGAAYLPLDPAWPEDRLRWILEDSGARFVIADATGRRILPASLRLLDAEELVQCSSDQHPEPSPSGAAYVMYTSGSTGRPKGVVVPQAAVLRLAVGGSELKIRPTDRLTQSAPLAFDASTFEIWGALLNGASLHVATRDEILDPDAFATAIKRSQATVLWITTALFNRQVDYALDCFGCLRMVITGGETMSPAHAGRLLEACPNLVLLNAYGPTENSTFTTLHRVRPADIPATSVPIGRPIAHTRVQVVDLNGAPVPVGVWGEIVTGGLGLAEGYLNQPDLTTERFPSDAEGNRIYRTGDLGRWRTDGTLEIGGRSDGQVKLRGYRVELEEIEQVINGHPEVAASAALFIRDGGGEGSIVACVQPAEGAAPQSAALRRWLGSMLPAYMVPRRCVTVPALPLTANGKIDRVRLMANLPPETNDVRGDLPQNIAERLIADVFTEVFGQRVEDRDANFLDLGGHSLLAIKVVNHIAQLTGVRLSMRDFFNTPTVAGLAALVERSNGCCDTIVRIPDAASYPASHAQARLYLATRMASGSDAGAAAYNIPFVLPFPARLDVAALHTALRGLTARHESLRTSFAEEDGLIVQRISTEADPPLTVDDVSSATDPRAEFLRLARREASTPLDLERAPLLRADAIRLNSSDTDSEEAWMILVVLHHIVCDGWSMQVLLREIDRLYRAAAQGMTLDLPALPIAYRDFAAWQNRRDWMDAAAHWRAALSGAPQQIDLPGDRSAAAEQSHRGDTVARPVPVELAARLSAFARAHGVSPGTVGLSLFACLLYRLTRQGDMVLGIGVSGRDRVEVEGLIGFFVNILPVRIRITDDTEFGLLVDQVHTSMLAAMDYRDYPFDLLVKELAPRRVANRQPLINVVFEYQRFDLNGHNSHGEGVFRAPHDADPDFTAALNEAIRTPTAKHDLLLFLIEREEGCEFVLEYDADLLDRSTAERWLSYLEQFASMVTNDAENESKT